MATTDLKEYLEEVAEAIRLKRHHDNLISPQDFVEEILEIGDEICSVTLVADGISGSCLYYDPINLAMEQITLGIEPKTISCYKNSIIKVTSVYSHPVIWDDDDVIFFDAITDESTYCNWYFMIKNNTEINLTY